MVKKQTQYSVKSLYSELPKYQRWTNVSQFLATGLVGVMVKKELK